MGGHCCRGQDPIVYNQPPLAPYNRNLVHEVRAVQVQANPLTSVIQAPLQQVYQSGVRPVHVQGNVLTGSRIY